MRISDWSSDVCSSDLLAAQELTDRRAQNRATIGGARIRRRAGALELQFPALAGRVDGLAQTDRTAIAELAGPVARSEARRVGKECVSPCRSRRAPLP